MPRSISPHDSAVAERGGAAGNGTDSSGSGGGASSSCGSDEEDGGDCSRDSSKSDSGSTQLMDAAAASSPVPLNGIEVKPCRSIDSLSSSTDSEQLHDNLLLKKQPNGDVHSPLASAANQTADFGGKLRFFRDGHCILELRHDLDDHGQPKQWMQSFGKTYHPCAPLPSALPQPPWQPQELPSLESQVDKNPQWPLAVNPPSAKAKKKLSNGQFLTYFVRSRHQSSQSLKMPKFSQCVLRRAARCPGRAVLDSNSFCVHEKGTGDCKNFKRLAGQHSSLFLRKSHNIANIAEGLASKCTTSECFNGKRQKESSSADSLLLEALLTSKREFPTQPHSNEEDQIQCKSRNPNSRKCCHPEENVQDEANGRSPSFHNTDVSKTYSADKEAKSHQRPLLHATLAKKRFSGSPMDMNLLDDACSSTLKKVKQECDILTIKDDGQCLRPSSSQSYNVRSFLANPAATIANLRNVGKDVQPVVPINDILPVKEITPVLSNPTRSLGDGDLGQPRKRKGGYGRGRTIGEAVRAFVIGDILNLGGDVRTKYVPRGVFTEVASRYKIDATTTYRWWLKHCNGMRMSTNGTTGHTDSSQKLFLPHGSSVGNYSCAPSGEVETRVINPYEKVDKHQFHGIISVPSPRGEQFSPMSIARENVHTKSYHNRSSHGDNQSPRSDDSASSGASLVDPASLYASSIACIPPNGAWQNLPSAANGRLSLPSPRKPFPAGIRMPYLFSYPSIPQFVNGLSENIILANGKEKSELHISDEPLDLTLPKQRSRNVESNLNYLIGSEASAQLPNLGMSSSYKYSECQPSKLILKTLLSAHDGLVENGRDNGSEVKLERKRKSVKVKSKGMDIISSPAQHCIKPKHYPFVSLQIGSFEVSESNVGFGAFIFFIVNNRIDLSSSNLHRSDEREAMSSDACAANRAANGRNLYTIVKRMLKWGKKLTHGRLEGKPLHLLNGLYLRAFQHYRNILVLGLHHYLASRFMFLRLQCSSELYPQPVCKNQMVANLTGGQLCVVHLQKITESIFH